MKHPIVVETLKFLDQVESMHWDEYVAGYHDLCVQLITTQSAHELIYTLAENECNTLQHPYTKTLSN